MGNDGGDIGVALVTEQIEAVHAHGRAGAGVDHLRFDTLATTAGHQHGLGQGGAGSDDHIRAGNQNSIIGIIGKDNAFQR